MGSSTGPCKLLTLQKATKTISLLHLPAAEGYNEFWTLYSRAAGVCSEEQKHGAEDEGFTCFITLLLLVQLTPSHETAAFFQSLKPV